MLQEKIKKLDLSYLESRLIDQKKWSLEEAKEAIRRYKNFLMLQLRYPDEVLAPAPDMDEVWHNHILYTHEYFRDCQAIFGEYLHHAPADHSDPEDKRMMQEAQSRTSELYIQEFNELYSLQLDIASFW